MLQSIGLIPLLTFGSANASLDLGSAPTLEPGGAFLLVLILAAAGLLAVQRKAGR
jgi:hypothetical protein